MRQGQSSVREKVNATAGEEEEGENFANQPLPSPFFSSFYLRRGGRSGRAPQGERPRATGLLEASLVGLLGPVSSISLARKTIKRVRWRVKCNGNSFQGDPPGREHRGHLREGHLRAQPVPGVHQGVAQQL